MNWETTTVVEVYDFKKLPIILEKFLELVKKAMQDEWQFCLGLHLHSRRKHTFHSRMQMQIQERLGLLFSC